jgi:hypothetical protein
MRRTRAQAAAIAASKARRRRNADNDPSAFPRNPKDDPDRWGPDANHQGDPL